MEKQERHVCLPKHLNNEELLMWLASNAVEKFTQKVPIYFTPEDVQEFEHESSVNGREFNRLKDIVKLVSEAVTKGNLEEPLTVTIPVTLGTKVLDVQRRQNDDNIERGYEENEVQVFAVPSPETKTMEFFTDEGKHIVDRSRGMSLKEQHEYIGIFLMNNPTPKPVVNEATSDIVDEDTGEVLGKTGTL